MVTQTSSSVCTLSLVKRPCFSNKISKSKADWQPKWESKIQLLFLRNQNMPLSPVCLKQSHYYLLCSLPIRTKQSILNHFKAEMLLHSFLLQSHWLCYYLVWSFLNRFTQTILMTLGFKKASLLWNSTNDTWTWISLAYGSSRTKIWFVTFL